MHLDSIINSHTQIMAPCLGGGAQQVKEPPSYLPLSLLCQAQHGDYPAMLHLPACWGLGLFKDVIPVDPPCRRAQSSPLLRGRRP